MVVSVYLYQCFQIPPTSFWNGPNHKNLPRLVTNPSLRKLEAKGGPRTEESLLRTLKVFWDKSLRKKYFMLISDRRCLLWSRGWCVDQAGFLWWDRKMVACWRLIMLVMIMKAMEDRNYWRLICFHNHNDDILCLARVQLRWGPSLVPEALWHHRGIEASSAVHKLTVRTAGVWRSAPVIRKGCWHSGIEKRIRPIRDISSPLPAPSARHLRWRWTVNAWKKSFQCLREDFQGILSGGSFFLTCNTALPMFRLNPWTVLRGFEHFDVKAMKITSWHVMLNSIASRSCSKKTSFELQR